MTYSRDEFLITTIARLLAKATDMAFMPLSAVFSGVADVRKAVEEARRKREMGQPRLLLGCRSRASLSRLSSHSIGKKKILVTIFLQCCFFRRR